MGNDAGTRHRSRFERWVVGTPRIASSVVWCGLGLMWFLLAVVEEPAVTRLLLGAAWMGIGLFNGYFALRDKRRGWGFYQSAASARLLYEEPPAPTTR
jgi:hypothetical protein